jgi:RHS repeat-associated protein
VSSDLGAVILPAAVASTQYDAAGELKRWGSVNLTYDANGNLTGDGTSTFTWDARNQLASVASPGGTTAFTYDPLGRRVSRTSGGTTTKFVYDGFNPVAETVGSVTASNFGGLGLDEYFTRTDATGTRTMLTDALGSTVALANGIGALRTTYRYGPYGATQRSGDPSGNPFQFTGRENDGNGLYSYRFRSYGTTFDRFLSRDPLGLDAGPNPYAYGDGNPVTFADPMGLDPDNDPPWWQTLFKGADKGLKAKKQLEKALKGPKPPGPPSPKDEYKNLQKQVAGDKQEKAAKDYSNPLQQAWQTASNALGGN